MSIKPGIESSPRLVSLDALRGFDMFWIIGGGAIFLRLFSLSDIPLFNTLSRQLEHAEWHGFTFWDLIFPLFLFIVGTSMPFSMFKRIERGDSKGTLYLHVVKRTVVLLILGLVYNGLLGFNFSEFRFAGVLQRIALCYFLASIVMIHLNIRKQAYTFGIILVIYWAVMKLIPSPGYSAGDLSPAGNLAGYLDRLLLPGRFCCYTFGDNEGFLSTLPAVATTLLGVLSGHWLRSSFSKIKKTWGLLLAGVGCLILGLLWGLFFPINKLIWSSSYVLYAGGWSLLLLGLFFWIIDVRGWKKWAFPFVLIGMNPITIYVAQSLFDFRILADIFIHGFVHKLGDFQPLFYSLCLLAVKWLFLYFLYKKKIFLKA